MDKICCPGPFCMSWPRFYHILQIYNMSKYIFKEISGFFWTFPSYCRINTLIPLICDTCFDTLFFTCFSFIKGGCCRSNNLSRELKELAPWDGDIHRFVFCIPLLFMPLSAQSFCWFIFIFQLYLVATPSQIP